MPRLFLLFFFFLICVIEQSSGQDMTMDTYTNQLLFNVFKERPDTTIAEFLKKHLPQIAKKNRTIPGDTLRYQDEIHSLVFSRHPFFHGNFTQGRLEFFCRRYRDPSQPVRLTNIQLWFEFDIQQEAEIIFSRLVDMFILVSTQKKFSSANGAQKAEFINTKETTGINRVRFRLTTDNVSRYRYKILFETTNDL